MRILDSLAWLEHHIAWEIYKTFPFNGCVSSIHPLSKICLKIRNIFPKFTNNGIFYLHASLGETVGKRAEVRITHAR